MLILGLIVFGLMAGAIAQLILGRSGWKINWPMAMVTGLIGSFVGGLLISLLTGNGLNLRPSGIIGSIVGATPGHAGLPVVAEAVSRLLEDRLRSSLRRRLDFTSTRMSLYCSSGARSRRDRGSRAQRGIGAVGSALPWHGRGQEFESPMLHHQKAAVRGRFPQSGGGLFRLEGTPREHQIERRNREGSSAWTRTKQERQTIAKNLQDKDPVWFDWAATDLRGLQERYDSLGPEARDWSSSRKLRPIGSKPRMRGVRSPQATSGARTPLLYVPYTDGRESGCRDRCPSQPHRPPMDWLTAAWSTPVDREQGNEPGAAPQGVAPGPRVRAPKRRRPAGQLPSRPGPFRHGSTSFDRDGGRVGRLAQTNLGRTP